MRSSTTASHAFGHAFRACDRVRRSVPRRRAWLPPESAGDHRRSPAGPRGTAGRASSGRWTSSRAPTFHAVSHLRTATEFCSQQMQQIAHFDRPDPDALAERLSVLLSDMNEIHPFREGNGCTQRFVIGRLAAQHGHPIAWRAIGPVQNLELSIASRSDPLAFARPLRTAMTAARGFGGSSTRGPDT